MKLSNDTKFLRKRLHELHLQMFSIAFEMEHFGDEETKKHAEELYGASKVCKEWSENAMVKR